MKKEAISNYYIINGQLFSTKNMEIFDRIKQGAIYEVIKIIDSIPLFFEAHMDRLRHSADLSGVCIKKTDKEILEEISVLVKKNQCNHINVKLVRSQPDGSESFLIYFISSEYPGKEAYEKGVHTILFTGERTDPNIKTLKGSFRERVQKSREEAGAYEALLMDEKGEITEGSRSNIFFMKKGEIFTPPAGKVLMGVTRQHVIKICENLGIKVTEKPLCKAELADIDGAFITGTTVDVLPICSIGEQKIPSVSQPLIQNIINEFKKEIRHYILEFSNFNVLQIKIL